MSKTKKNWAERIKELFDRHPITILIILIVFLISSFFTILNGFSWFYDTYKKTLRWREIEYMKINHLSAGLSLDKYTEILGSPDFVRISKGGLKESIFKEKDHWIQTISDSVGQVLFYAITVCDYKFKPEISNNPFGDKIVLNESKFKSATHQPVRLRYFLSGATANSYFFDEYYLGNPGYYQTVFLGINDACPYNISNLEEMILLNNKYDIQDEIVDKFRSATNINTYGTTAPLVSPDELFEEFQIGVDRTQIRVLNPTSK